MNEATLESRYVSLDPIDCTGQQVSSPDEPDGTVRRVDDKWLPRAQRQLTAIENLSTDSDLDGGTRSDPRTILRSSVLLNSIFRAMFVPKPHINPTPSGGVQFDWETDDRYFEIELIDPVTAEYYFEDRASGDVKEGTLYGGQPLGDVITCLNHFVPSV